MGEAKSGTVASQKAGEILQAIFRQRREKEGPSRALEKFNSEITVEFFRNEEKLDKFSKRRDITGFLAKSSAVFAFVNLISGNNSFAMDAFIFSCLSAGFFYINGVRMNKAKEDLEHLSKINESVQFEAAVKISDNPVAKKMNNGDLYYFDRESTASDSLLMN